MNSLEPTVFVVDDDISVREAITNLLRSVRLRVETFSTAQAFRSRPRYAGPTCLVLDVRLPGSSGLDLQQQLAQAHEKIPIIFITGHADVPMSVRAMKAGAVEFLTKPFRDQELLDAVGQALRQDEKLRRREAETAKLRERYSMLTAREHEVMKYVVLGLVNKQIAAKLGITEPTVKLHRGRVMRKLEVKSLADLVRMAQELQAPHPEGVTGSH
jgi:FixJ family two-component response regulator